jgi:nicotinamide mononucleotide transporter
MDFDYTQIFYDWWSFVAFATGLLAVLLITFARWPNLSWWNWPLGLVSTGIYTWLLYDAELYASAGLNAFFAVSALYGMWAWKFGGTNKTPLPIRKANREVWAWAVFFIGFFTGIAYAALDLWTDNPEPFWDAAFVGISIAAQFIMTRRFLEHWYLWILSDLIAVPLFISQDLDSLALLYLVYLGLCIWPGLVEWYKEYSRQGTIPLPTNPLIPAQTGVDYDHRTALHGINNPVPGNIDLRAYDAVGTTTGRLGSQDNNLNPADDEIVTYGAISQPVPEGIPDR